MASFHDLILVLSLPFPGVSIDPILARVSCLLNCNNGLISALPILQLLRGLLLPPLSQLLQVSHFQISGPHSPPWLSGSPGQVCLLLQAAGGEEKS